MDPSDVDSELVAALNNRLDVLTALETPTDKRTLTDTLDLSRSTIDRAVRELEALGLITRTEGYRLTVTGRLVVERYRSFTADLEFIMDTEALLAFLPPDAPISARLVVGATINRSTPPVPTEPLDDVNATVGDATAMEVAIPHTTRPDVLDTFYERVVDDGIPTDVIFSDEIVAHFETNRPEWFERLLACPNAAVAAHPDLPYALGVFTTGATRKTGLVVYGDDSEIKGYLEHTAPGAADWAQSVLATFREDARQLANADLTP